MIGRVVLGLTLAAAALVVSPAPAPDLRGVDALAHVYDEILDARFERAEADLPRACGPAPPQACDVLAGTITWWRILLDPDSRTLDDEFSNEVERAIASTEAWAKAQPRNAEAQFYTGAAYALRVQWRVLRGEKVAAARDGKRIRQALERALRLDPSLDDAYFGIGMYKYYADVAPAAAKVLRFLLLLPGGSRKEGLAEMLRARARGELLQGEADYQLQIIYLWYEKRTDKAVALLESLHERYPGNPLFVSQLATVHEQYEHDMMASLGAWQDLLTAAREHRVNEAGLAEVEARLAIARLTDRLYETDRTLEQLRSVIQARPLRPYGALADAYLALGEGEDRLGHRDAAIAAYRLAVATAPSPDVHDVRDRASDRIDREPDATRAEAYRLSLEGLRKLERGDAEGAAAALGRSVTLNPASGVAHDRYGRALKALKEYDRALAAFERALGLARTMPAPMAAATYLDAARLCEQLGRRDEAISLYRSAATWFGGGTSTRRAAERALDRLRASR